MRLIQFVAIALVAGLVVGCEKSEKVATHSVMGAIYYDGKPAVGVQVYLYPTSAPGVPVVPAQPHGTTGPDGRFKLSTFGNDDGAAEGGYQIVLFWPQETEEDAEESDTDRLLGWYTAAHSKLTVQVQAGHNELPQINLPPMKYPPSKSEGVPGRN